MPLRKKRLLITGGHFTPALAVIEEFNKRGGWSIFWIGEKKAFQGKGVETLEVKMLPFLDIPFYSISFPKLHRKFKLLNLLSFFKLPLGFFQSLFLIFRIKPNAVLSFGSYISLPVVVSSWLLRVPVVVHEQTSVSGLANRVASKFAKYVAVSNKNSLRYFPVGKTYLTGNPVRRGIWEGVGKKTNNTVPVVYITGGSRGARLINRVVFKILPVLLVQAKVLHQTGQLDIEKARKIRSGLPLELKKNYFVSANLTPDEVEEVYKKADLVVSRAGANTVSELEVLEIPAILIPIPWTESNEQLRNAEGLARVGTGVVISEENLNSKVLLEKIRDILKNPQKYRIKKTEPFLARKDACQKLADLVEAK